MGEQCRSLENGTPLHCELEQGHQGCHSFDVHIPTVQAINVIFDGPPSNESGRFVEVETDNGLSINAGEWIERPDGLWALRITKMPDA